MRRFFDALGEIGAREKVRLFWILGIDMAHMGRRYGDEFQAVAEIDKMEEVALRDKGFWDLVQPHHDELKWCGSSLVYTFLKCVPEARGVLQRCKQWNIDKESVVSFAGMTFSS